MSVFIVIDSANQKYSVKLIDLVSMIPIPQDDGPSRDDGMIKGFNSLLDIVGEIQIEEEEVEWTWLLSLPMIHVGLNLRYESLMQKRQKIFKAKQIFMNL